MIFPISAVLHPAVPAYEGAGEKTKVTFLNSKPLSEYYKTQMSQQAVCEPRLSSATWQAEFWQLPVLGAKSSGELPAKEGVSLPEKTLPKPWCLSLTSTHQLLSCNSHYSVWGKAKQRAVPGNSAGNILCCSSAHIWCWDAQADGIRIFAFVPRQQQVRYGSDGHTRHTDWQPHPEGGAEPDIWGGAAQ